MSQFYITTPLYYVNDKPHIGTSYSTILSDIFARYHKLFGDETYLMTGTDEHGQKVQQAAEQRGKQPLEHCNEMNEEFIKTWKELNIDYNQYFRTTTDWHQKAVQDSLQKLYDEGKIYEATYAGWYSVSEEIFYTEKDLIDGKSPAGKEVTKIEEKNYFFRMSDYQQQLIDHIQDNPNFILPHNRKNEVLGFLKKPLQDLCISRPKSRLQWGIELPFDKDYVTYVWFDALLNYATGVGFQRKGMSETFEKWWNQAGANHIIGKDILTTHAVYWTTMLMALGLKLPKTIFAHGWILNKDNDKMSKSSGDVVSPLEMKDQVGVDPFRYYLAREIHFGNDGPFSKDLLVNRINTELSNNIGNLLSRTTNLIAKYFDGKPPVNFHQDESTENLKKKAIATADLVKTEIENFAPSHAIEHIVSLLNEANRYLEETAPWKQAKEDVEAAGKSLSAALETLRICAILLKPVMPERIDNLLTQIGCQNQGFKEAKLWPAVPTDIVIEKSKPLFPRLDL